MNLSKLVDEELVRTIVGSSLPINHLIDRIYSGKEHGEFQEHVQYLRNNVDETLDDFRKLHNRRSYLGDDFAHLWIVARAVSARVCEYRLQTLCNSIGETRPKPYNHSALTDVEIDKNGLVSLAEFDDRGFCFERNGYRFTMLDFLGNYHSSYWIASSLQDPKFRKIGKIRLDPFRFGESSSFHPFEIRMDVFGKPFDWEQIKKTSKIEKGRFLSDDTSQKFQQWTDYLWNPEPHQIGMTFEELPRKHQLSFRGSIYAHGYYQRSIDKFIHLDGATRIYSTTEFETRETLNLDHPDVTKLGTRIKFFSLDGEIDVKEAFEIVAKTYVYNPDVQEYFGNDVIRY